jgi:hypothetical protein
MFCVADRYVLENEAQSMPVVLDTGTQAFNAPWLKGRGGPAGGPRPTVGAEPKSAARKLFSMFMLAQKWPTGKHQNPRALRFVRGRKLLVCCERATARLR